MKIGAPVAVGSSSGITTERLLKEWERGVLLRLGRFQRVLGPGINWTFPGFDRLVATVDMRIRSTPFQTEKTLTKDTVAVNTAPYPGCGARTSLATIGPCPGSLFTPIWAAFRT